MDVLVVDIGGSHVKLFESAHARRSRFSSHPGLEPAEVVSRVLQLGEDWRFDVVSIGYPGAAGPGGTREPAPKLGGGWVGFDFAEAFKRPVRIVNDAAMQALGAYDGGRMLFLGLGTGLGSAMVGERVIIPLELGSLPHPSGDSLAGRLGKAGLAEYGFDAWQASVADATAALKQAFAADYVVLGGGNAEKVNPLPAGARRGGNEDAFAGGVRLWEDWVEAHDVPRSSIWRVVW